MKQITTGKKSLRSSTACTILVNTTVGLNAFSGAFAEKTEICHRNQPACTPLLYADLRTLITLFPRVTQGFIVELKPNSRRKGSENKCREVLLCEHWACVTVLSENDSSRVRMTIMRSVPKTDHKKYKISLGKYSQSLATQISLQPPRERGWKC